MTPSELTKRIKAEARVLGFDLVGVARADRVDDDDRLAEWLGRGYHGTMGWMASHFGKRVDPRELVPGCRSIVCLGLVYHRPADEAPQPEQLEVATYAWGEDYHRVLKDKLGRLLERGRALDPTFDGRSFVDSAPVMDKYWAERAGLGWRGKNTNLLNVRLGSFLFLGEILTTAELVPDLPGTDHCGTCTRCLEACPTGALVEPYVLDARRCISYWTIEHRDALEPAEEDAVGEWIFGCDVCQDVCPWNRDAPAATEGRFTPRGDAWPATLDDMLTLSPDEFRRRFGDTAIERTRRRGLVRNAAIVAGNTGLGSDAALSRAAADPDPVVAEAAHRAEVKRSLAPPLPDSPRKHPEKEIENRYCRDVQLSFETPGHTHSEGEPMYVAVEHKISDPSTFWSLAEKLVPQLPEGIALHHCHPAPDGTRGICVWEVESVEKLRTFLDGKVGHVSRNDYYQVENKDAVALPTAV